MILGQNAVVIINKLSVAAGWCRLRVIIRKSKCGKMWEMHEMPQCFKGLKSRFFRFPVVHKDYLEISKDCRLIKSGAEWQVDDILSAGDITLTVGGVKQLAKECNLTWANHFVKKDM